jgi:translocation and assembly module TamB
VRHWLKVALLTLLGVVAFLLLLDQTGLPRWWVRRAVVRRIETITGGAVELGEFRFSLWRLRAEAFNLTVHGREAAKDPPFFHVNYVRADIRIVSVLGRKIALDELRLDRPAVAVRIARDGTSNAPRPPAAARAAGPLREQLFDLTVGKLQILQGEVRWNDIRRPLAMESSGLRFQVRYEAPASGAGAYHGELTASRLRLQAGRTIPFASDLEARFNLGRNAFDLEQVTWKLPHSDLRGRATLADFAAPAWTFSYQSRIDFRDIRELLRVPAMPDGRAELSGEGRWAAGTLSTRGAYTAREIALPYLWFHARGFASSGHFEIAQSRLTVPDFSAEGLGGRLDGRLELLFRGLRFRLESDLDGMSLAGILAALDHPSFPVAALHWDSRVAVHATTTWEAGFNHLDSRGTTTWTPPVSPAPGFVPVATTAAFHFSRDLAAADLTDGLITSPSTKISFGGRLGSRDTALQLNLEVADLLPFDDFINALRGQDAEPQKITGRGSWKGNITGPLGTCTIAGHFHATDAAYAELRWDEVEGDVSYAPDHLELRDTRAHRGHSSARVTLGLTLTAWSFLPENPWTFDVRVARTEMDGIQSLLGTAYPVRGLLSGHLAGGGTREEPDFAVNFDVEKPEFGGFPFDRARGEVRWTGEDLHARNLDLRKGSGRASGSLDYDRDTGWISFDLRGQYINIEEFPLMTGGLMPASGRLAFEVKGEGPLRSPHGSGTFHLAKLRVGEDALGDFDVRATSDGRQLLLDASSAMPRGGVNGHAEVSLTAAFPVNGELQLQDVALDTFLKVALRLKDLTGHSSVNGRFLLSGELFGPAGVNVHADISHIAFDYAFVKLENDGPVRFTYQRDEIQVESAHLRGPDTDLALSGRARFARDRQLNLRLDGLLNLRLLSGVLPDLDARGPAQLAVTLRGTTARPRLEGRLTLQKDSATYGDFPVALSEVSGDVLFDINRLTFDGVNALVGGGRALLSGSVSYGEGPVHYDVLARGRGIRVRYPEGMSWLMNGNLRLQGSTTAASLGGRVIVERLLLTEGIDLSAVMGSKAGGPGPSAGTSAYLRNLQLDVEAISSPDAKLEWNSARFASEADLHVRGTAEHPVILGQIRLLAGEFDFRGNRFRLTRGDINFTNPFRLDPVLDLEATTTVQQYDVSILLSGPGSRLVLSYRSDPPLPSADIITLLALGTSSTATRELRPGTGAQQSDLGAQALISEAVSSQLGGRIEKLFGVSRFRVDPSLSSVGATQNAAARVTIQQRITHDLTVTYVTDVTSTQRQVVLIEYNLSRKLTVSALRDENGTFGVDLVVRKYFK